MIIFEFIYFLINLQKKKEDLKKIIFNSNYIYTQKKIRYLNQNNGSRLIAFLKLIRCRNARSR